MSVTYKDDHPCVVLFKSTLKKHGKPDAAGEHQAVTQNHTAGDLLLQVSLPGGAAVTCSHPSFEHLTPSIKTALIRISPCHSPQTTPVTIHTITGLPYKRQVTSGDLGKNEDQSPGLKQNSCFFLKIPFFLILCVNHFFKNSQLENEYLYKMQLKFKTSYIYIVIQYTE